MAASATAALVVMIVFFGEMPPWLPLTLHSMALNERVKFVVIGDAEPPPVVPRNVVFERISYGDMQVRLSRLLDPANESAVRYNWTYKANDIKPLAPALYAHHLAGHEWWAWADLDVVFGDLVKFLSFASRRPACCKVPLRKDGTPKSVNRVNVYSHSGACPCPPNTRANVVCPLYPNPWRKKAWGPFTAFRVDFGAELFRQSPQWREVIVSNEYAHFDEFWGPFHYSRGWETMGDVLTRLAEVCARRIFPCRRLCPRRESGSERREMGAAWNGRATVSLPAGIPARTRTARRPGRGGYAICPHHSVTRPSPAIRHPSPVAHHPSPVAHSHHPSPITHHPSAVAPPPVAHPHHPSSITHHPSLITH